ncbi:(2Fe-2S)-binding protein [Providencia alcalifaciens]
MKINNAVPIIERKPLTLTINGQKIGPIDVPVGMPMIEFLHEYLDLTGTHFGCGQGICHACTIMEIQPDGSTVESRTCIFGAHYFNNKNIVTIEGQAKLDEQGKVVELTPIQQAFIENFSFQCGYCAPGFVTGATVFLDKLKKKPVKRDQLEHAIEEALNEHICRCTGYVRYYEAVRKVALDTPGCVID